MSTYLHVIVYYFPENMPCLGTRNGPNREYTWLTYDEVRLKHRTLYMTKASSF